MKSPLRPIGLLLTLIAALSLSANSSAQPMTINSDGANPNAGLLLAGNTLYGTTATCGSEGFGTVFGVNTDGTGFRVLHTFTGSIDGAHPWAGLILSGHTLYGTTYSGGAGGQGTVFAVNIDGSGFTSVHSFSGGSDGGNPIGGLILTNNTLCGTTQLGGSSGNGTVFKISFAPQLSAGLAGTNLVVSWPTNYAGFDYAGYNLESTTAARPAAWTAELSSPVIVNGQKSVTSPITGAQQFYRLKR